jgi:hypothetical protein
MQFGLFFTPKFLFSGSIKKNNMRGIADRGILASELQLTG